MNQRLMSYVVFLFVSIFHFASVVPASAQESRSKVEQYNSLIAEIEAIEKVRDELHEQRLQLGQMYTTEGREQLLTVFLPGSHKRYSAKELVERAKIVSSMAWESALQRPFREFSEYVNYADAFQVPLEVLVPIWQSAVVNPKAFAALNEEQPELRAILDHYADRTKSKLKEKVSRVADQVQILNDQLIAKRKTLAELESEVISGQPVAETQSPWVIPEPRNRAEFGEVIVLGKTDYCNRGQGCCYEYREGYIGKHSEPGHMTDLDGEGVCIVCPLQYPFLYKFETGPVCSSKAL